MCYAGWIVRRLDRRLAIITTVTAVPYFLRFAWHGPIIKNDVWLFVILPIGLLVAWALKPKFVPIPAYYFAMVAFALLSMC